jgi:hypothetical protein
MNAVFGCVSNSFCREDSVCSRRSVRRRWILIQINLHMHAAGPAKDVHHQ